MNYKKRQIILVTSGEPAGIGPDICLDLAFNYVDPINYLVVVIGDIELLLNRAKLLKKNLEILPINENDIRVASRFNISKQLLVFDIKCPNKDCIGKLDVNNAVYVLDMLDLGISLCKRGLSSILITAPISKEIINQYGVSFNGHTEYLRDKFECHEVVMMLANQHLKVALATTHLPLKKVATMITSELLERVLSIIIKTFIEQFSILSPRVGVCGLNPHAGEGGYLGDEELLIINPLIKKWQQNGYKISGAYPADTIFNFAHEFDVILAMYHDQGLPVLKYSGFETGINITLGLPIVRVSVDHGTALNLAGTGMAISSSLIEALKFTCKQENIIKS